jgi:endonuclease/exonuclease/phosphatase (EEP) superfamily protein YafD
VGRAASAAVATLGVLVVGSALDTRLWPGPVLSFFRPQLALALALAATLAFAAGRWRTGLAGVALALLGAALVLPAVRDPAPEPPVEGAPTVRLLALNLTHRNDDVAPVVDLIRRERPDVVTFSELTPEWARALAEALAPYPVRAAEPREGATGIGLYGGDALREPRVVRLFGDERGSVEARLALPGGRRGWLLSVHPTSGLEPGTLRAHRDSFSALAVWAEERGPLAAVCGDLNAVPWMGTLRQTLERGGLRAAVPGGPLGGSWPRVPRPLRAPIDGCLVGTGLRARARLGPDVGSDHLPLLVELG